MVIIGAMYVMHPTVLSVWASDVAMQCPQVQIDYHHAGLWA